MNRSLYSKLVTVYKNEKHNKNILLVIAGKILHEVLGDEVQYATISKLEAELTYEKILETWKHFCQTVRIKFSQIQLIEILSEMRRISEGAIIADKLFRRDNSCRVIRNYAVLPNTILTQKHKTYYRRI